MKFEFYKSKAEWRWRLWAGNGKNIANGGEGYERFSAMLKTLRRIFGDNTALEKAVRLHEQTKDDGAKETRT